jgi:hypothetical protein
MSASIISNNANAVEVAAMLGDSVVGVKHCMDPRSGKVSTRTWTMIGIAAACLLASTIAFGISVHTAAMNKAGLDYWTHVAHKPAFSFRGTELSTAYDFVAFGGLSVGLSLMIAALLRVRDERRSPYYRIGNAPGVELAIEHAPAAAFPLVAPRGDDFVFNYAPGIEGELVLDGRTTPLAELAAKGVARPSPTIVGAFELPIPDRARIRARAGLATMLVSSVEKPRRQSVPVMAALESRTMKYFAGSLAAHLGIWAFLQMVPADDGAASVDLATIEDTNPHAINIAKEPPPPPPETGDQGDGTKDGAEVKAPLSEGEAGTQTAGNDPKHIQLKDRGAEPQLSREAAIEQAREAGVLGSMPMLTQGIASAAAENDFTSGFDTTDQRGGVFDGSSEGGAGFGLGRNGWGGGGGCMHEPCGGVGAGDYMTHGHGTRAGDGFGIPGSGTHGMPGHHAQAPEPRIGQANIIGDYDKSIIRRHIKLNIDKIGYCYEKQLIAHPDMQGEILVQFFIQPNGTVRGSTGTGFDSEVANCVAGVVGRIEFPAPKGGGITVNYPFTFHPAGK